MKSALPFIIAFITVLTGYSQQKPSLRKEVKSYSAIQPDRVGQEPIKTKPMTTAVLLPPHNFGIEREVNFVTVTSIGTSVNAFSYGYAGGQKSILYANNDINTVTHIHRMGGTLDPGGYSGDLGVDISTNGGMTWSNQNEIYISNISGGTYNIDAARYPNHGIWNPEGNTDPDNAYVTFLAPTIDGTNGDSWGGYAMGRARIGDLMNDTTKNLTHSTPPFYQYIPDAYDVSNEGIIIAVDANQDWTSGTVVYQGSLIVYRGEWDDGMDDFIFERTLIDFPTNAENDRPVHVKFAFGPDGLTGWIVVISDNQTVTPLWGDRYYYPIFIKTTDGGQTWGEPFSVRLDGPYGLNGVLNYLTDQQIADYFEPPVPARDEIAYTTAFDCDIVVDLWGNPHVGVVVGIGGIDNEYSIGTASEYFAAFDISSTDGGTTWDGYCCGKLNQFRGTFGTDYTEDNRIQASSTQDGNKVFITWLDTRLEGAEENNAPDIYARGIDVSVAPDYRSLTTNEAGEDLPNNVTTFSEAMWQAYFMVTSRITLDDGDGTYTIPFSYEALTTPFDPALPVQYKYIQDFTFTDNDFELITDTPEIDVDPMSLTIYEPTQIYNEKNKILGDKKRMSPIPTGKIDPCYIADTIYDENNRMIICIRVPGKPPENYRAPVAQFTRTSVILPNTPAYDWSFGCSATAAAMMAGYYDNNDYPEVYTGPTNGGIAPLTNQVWGSVMINGEERKLCPISATMDQLDGRTIFGHVDDYWIVYGSNAPDPFIGNWTEHAYGDCTGDYMKTNQYNYGNSDGSTLFYYYPDGSPYFGNEFNDGCYGLKLYFESRGYVVEDYFTQLIYGYDGNNQGFSFSDYMNEIDAGNPVMIHVQGHSMLGFGYDDNNNTVYLHDTWDYADHQMIWGSDYEGLDHWGVTVIHLADAPISGDYLTINNIGTAYLAVSSITADQPWLLISGYPTTPFNIAPGSAEEVSIEIDWIELGGFTQTGNIIITSNDSNEPVVTVPVTAIPLGIPDLIIQNQNVEPVTVEPGGSANASCEVLNQGTAGAGASNLKYYLSANSTFGSGDIELGSDTVGSLGSGQFSSQDQTLIIPSGTASGMWFVLFFADADLQVTESDENNNVSNFQIYVQLNTPDLVTLNQDVTPVSVYPGGNVIASCNVSNQGNGSAGSSNLKYYLSVNNSFGGGDQLLGTDAVSSLDAGQSSFQNQTLSIPASTASGIWFILFYADADNQVEESNENNNVSYFQINVQANSPDLVAVNPEVEPLIIMPGGSINASCDIYNQGDGVAGSCNLKYFLSANNTYGSGDQLLGTDAVDALGAGESVGKARTLIVPLSTSAGTWFILFYADADNQVSESNENNNVAYSQITVEIYTPDIIVLNQDINPTTVAPGDNLEAECDIFNQGTGDAGISQLNYYLSSDNVFSINDQLLGSDIIGNLGSGQSMSQDQVLTIPSSIAEGIWYILYFGDATQQIEESNENNNVASKQITVNILIYNLVLDPATNDFGSINTGDCTDEFDFILSNYGTETVSGSVYLAGSGAGDFEISEGGANYSLPSYFSKTVKVRFCPKNTGNLSAQLYVTASPGDDVMSVLTGYSSEIDHLVVSTDSIELNPSLGSSKEVTITSNVSWVISGYPTWLDLSMVNGIGNASLTITANSNNFYDVPRIANLIFSGNNVGNQNLTVLQLPFTGINETGNISLQVYPNPASGYINIDVSGLIEKPESVDMINSLGLRICRYLYPDPVSDMITINTNGLAYGAYYLRVNFKNNCVNKLVLITNKK